MICGLFASKRYFRKSNEKVFIFNGWTFSSNPSLAPIDHAIYDIWFVGCESA